MINRVFLIMLRNRLFREAPEILANQEIDIEYVSPMAIAQKGQELQNVMRGLELFGSLAQTMPVMDYIDENGLVKQLEWNDNKLNNNKCKCNNKWLKVKWLRMLHHLLKKF